MWTAVWLAAAACGPPADGVAPARASASAAEDLAAEADGRRGEHGEHGTCGEDLRPLVEAKMAELGVPGAVVLVDVPGTCRWIARLGTRNVATERPFTFADHVRVGSITKTFTGTAVLQLADEGAIDLGDPISRYVDGVPNGENISVRQVLQMTSGLYSYSEDLGFNASLDAHPDRVWSVSELLDIAFLAHEPYFPPGGGFHYSNTNTALLGKLVEAVTGHELRNELRRRIFRPLRMRETSLPALDDASIPEPHPRGYTYGTNVGTLPPSCDATSVGRHDVTNASPSWTWAAGGAISTLGDLTIWAHALALGTLLSPAMHAEQLTWVSTGAGGPRYGLHVTDFFGIIGHDGALPGFQSFMGYVPDKRATLVILTNVYPDLHCGGPADELAKLVGGQLGLFTPP
jgi:D-alanyl-D-alanine carboxypeptidase